MPFFVAWHAADAVAGPYVQAYDAAALPPSRPGWAWHPIAGEPRTSTLALVDGAVTEVPCQPPLDQLKAERRLAARAYRDARQAGGCATALGRLDTDDASLLKLNSIAGAAAGAIAAKTAFPVKALTLADGTEAATTATKAVAAQAAVVAMLDACQQAYLLVKARIATAATAEALAAIDIAAGYPA